MKNKEFRVYFQLDSQRRLRGFVEAHEIWGNRDFSRIKVVLDRQATLIPKDGSSWWVRMTGSTKDRRMVFVLPIEPAKERARREWQRKLKEREAAEARAAKAAARELKRLDPALVAEVESIMAAIQAGPTRPAPARPSEPTPPNPSVLGSWGDYTVNYSPGEVNPFSIRAEYLQAGPARGALSEGVDVALRFERAGELIEALREKGCPDETLDNISAKSALAEAERVLYRAELAEYEAAQAEYEAARQAWLSEGHNRLVDLHRRGWLQIDVYGGRDWLFAASPDGDCIPVLARAQLERALK